jgi:uncharacterized membrane protein YcaP (DUF421 family)
MSVTAWLGAGHRSACLWPVSIFWVVASSACAAVAAAWITWQQAVIMMLVFAIFLVACSILQQISQVHRLVDGQRDELIQEVRTLRRALNDAGIATTAPQRREPR